mmetsp:Transcript_21882/g.68800  ORF Transcript_21882/g.68800 Transcript_21882/m.68800 type:complete len:209 (+) Transcript_21882:103-729(+)
MKMARPKRSALWLGSETPPKSTSKWSTSGARKNLQQPGTFFFRDPTWLPFMSSTLKFTSAQGPQGRGQQRPHWQQPPFTLRAGSPWASRTWKARSQQAKGSEIEPIFCPVFASVMSTAGLLKQQQVQVQSRCILKACVQVPSSAVYRMSRLQGSQSGAHCFSSLCTQSNRAGCAESPNARPRRRSPDPFRLRGPCTCSPSRSPARGSP